MADMQNQRDARANAGTQTRVLQEKNALGVHIFGVNLLALIVLIVGIFYVSEHRENLIRAELELLRTEVELASAALTRAGRSKSTLDRATAQDIGDQLNTILNHRLLVYTTGRELVLDDGKLVDSVQKHVRNEARSGIPPTIDALFQYAVSLIPIQINLPTYKNLSQSAIGHHPDALKALDGNIAISAWKAGKGRIVLSAAAPIRRDGTTLGVVQILKDDTEIAAASAQARLNVMRIFVGALGVTVLISIYLSGIIGEPLRRLATAAEAVRLGYVRHTEIPDYSNRGDEIGELSLSLREMTQALWKRMDMIERFAVDVAHELKNPITSLRSAADTAKHIDDPQKRAKLFDVMMHDIARMDRLISDISSSTRLDSALLQEQRGRINIVRVLTELARHYGTPQERIADEGISQSAHGPVELRIATNNAQRVITLKSNTDQCYVLATEERLIQIFDNLIANALSFTPEDGVIGITLTASRDTIEICVDDNGPGIPDDMLECIFERFYTHRPDEHGFGSHSGLGLAIVKQIVDNMGGTIRAENRADERDNITGARFVVVLNRVT